MLYFLHLLFLSIYLYICKRLRDDALTCFADPLVRSGMILFGICVRGYYLRREKMVAK